MTLRSYLQLRGLSVAEIARQVDVHEGTVYRWMAGTTEPKTSEALKIARLTEGAVPVEAWERTIEPDATAPSNPSTTGAA